MDSSGLLFMDKPSIGCFDVVTEQFSWRNQVATDDEVFQHLDQALATGEFDYYYRGDMLLIPDPIPIPRVNWHSVVVLGDGQEITCRGAFIACFHAHQVSSGILVSSLTFPEFERLKVGLKIV